MLSLHQVSRQFTPISFFSTKLSKTQTKYSTFSRELLIIYLSIEHFQYLLEGRDFTIYTVHKPLIYTLYIQTDKYSPWEIRHLDYISQFSSGIRHVSGQKKHSGRHTVTCHNSSLDSSSLNYKLIAKEQTMNDSLEVK